MHVSEYYTLYHLSRAQEAGHHQFVYMPMLVPFIVKAQLLIYENMSFKSTLRRTSQNVPGLDCVCVRGVCVLITSTQKL